MNSVDVDLVRRAYKYAWDDVKLRYSRSLLGPLWIMVGMAIFILTKGFLFSEILETDIVVYLPFLGSGIIIWTWLSSQVAAATNIYPRHRNTIQNINIPIEFYLYHHVSDSSITFLHNFLIIILLSIYFGYAGLSYFLIIPGAALLLLFGFHISSIMAMIGARYRDVGHLIQSLMRVIFFLTPIMWMPEMISDDLLWVVDANPFYHLIQLIRAPLMHQAPSLYNWSVALVILVLLYIINFALMNRYKTRIVFWI